MTQDLFGKLLPYFENAPNQTDTFRNIITALICIASRRSLYSSKETSPSSVILRYVEYAILNFTLFAKFPIHNTNAPDIEIRECLLNKKHINITPNFIFGDELDEMYPEYKYDVCVSFSGTDRSKAEKLCNLLKSKYQLELFYDEYEKYTLWGSDLITHLYDIYHNKSQLCVVFFSREYLRRAWTRHELNAAMMRSIRDKRGYMLPIIVDDGSCPEELQNLSHIKYVEDELSQISDAINEKVWSYKKYSWVDVDTLTETINRDILAGAICDHFINKIGGTSDEHRKYGYYIIGLMVLTQSSMIGEIQKLLEYLSRRNESIAGLLSIDGEFAFEGEEPCILRWAGKDGPFLLQSEYFEPLAKPAFDRFKSNLGEEAEKS